MGARGVGLALERAGGISERALVAQKVQMRVYPS